MKFRPRTFADRLTRRIMIVVLLILTLTMILIVVSAWRGLYFHTRAQCKEFMFFTNEMMTHLLEELELSAINTSHEFEKVLNNPDEFYPMLTNILERNPHIHSVYLAFKPNYYPEKGLRFEPVASRRPGGRIDTLQVASETHDYFKSEIYIRGINEPKGHWSEPYYDKDGAQTTVISYTLPLHDTKGKTVGIFGIDMPLYWIDEHLKKMDEESNKNLWVLKPDDKRFASYCFIINKNGTFIVHPDKKRLFQDNDNILTRASASTDDDADDKLARHMIAGSKGDTIAVIDGVKSFVTYSSLDAPEWSMAIVVPTITMAMMGYILGAMVLVLMLLGMIAIYFVCRMNIRRVTKPLQSLAKSADEVSKGNFEAPLPFIKYQDEIHTLRDSFKNMQASLTQYISDLEKTTATKAAIENELSIARRIQMSMIPNTFPPFPSRTDIDIFSSLTPAKTIGGDVFDYFIRDEKLYFCIGDVSGKGIPAALMMTVTHALFETIAAHEEQPQRIMSMINDAFIKETDADMFCTFFMGVLNLQTGTLTYCNAGHEYPLLIGKGVEKLSMLPNLPLGTIEGFTYKEQEIQLQPGTVLFLYTDGLTDANNIEEERFDRRRVIATAEQALGEGDATPNALIQMMTRAVSAFVGEADQTDDLAMLAIKYQ